jgi:hypothetical protein
MDSQNRSLSQFKKQASKIWQKGTEYAVSFRQYVLHGHGMRNRIQKRVATLSFTWTSYKPLGSSHNKWLESVNSCESWSRQDEGQPQISIADCINCDTHWFRPSPDEHQPTDGFQNKKLTIRRHQIQTIWTYFTKHITQMSQSVSWRPVTCELPMKRHGSADVKLLNVWSHCFPVNVIASR